MRPARLSRMEESGAVKCLACAHGCLIAEGRTGLCSVRRTVKGELQSLVYGLPAAVALDPIEKKPLYHFLPGSTALSLGTFGCNFSCTFCQNYELSQARNLDDQLSRLPFLGPEAVVQLALRQGASSIACTYNEPAVWAEYALDIAVQAREAGLRTVFVSNGFYSRELLDEALPLIDACNIDLKSFSDDFYRRLAGGRLQPVLDAIRAIHEAGTWEEITSLIIPGMNDSEEEVRAMAHFVASVDPAMPWHVSRFFPMYHMQDRPVTPSATIERAVQIGHEEGLLNVYSGNLPGHDEASDTRCPQCGATVIERHGYAVTARTGLTCPTCGTRIKGVER
ncbi:MAG: AmmeMemoRadiSam system radical SAM enzyme [Caldiserica bacterium]|nr:AmmeMemoRadiSam system radical SAM enzyme [Caldisericota bacterium]